MLSTELNENAAKSLMTVVVRLFIFLLIGDILCVIVTPHIQTTKNSLPSDVKMFIIK